MRSNKPQNISKTVWYYEEPKHIEIIHERKHADGYAEYDHIKIPYHRIRKTLARVDDEGVAR